jgi:hypothetical protein
MALLNPGAPLRPPTRKPTTAQVRGALETLLLVYEGYVLDPAQERAISDTRGLLYDIQDGNLEARP